MLFKSEQYFTVGNAVNENGWLCWIPGTLSAGGIYDSLDGRRNMVAGTADKSNDNIAWTTAGVTDLRGATPGATFLDSNAAVYRPVAACIEVMWNGTEAARAGQVSGGVVAAGSLYRQTASPDGVSILVPNTDRTPVNHLEYIWYPSAADEIWTDPSTQIGDQQVDRRNALAIAWTNIGDGVTASPGFRIKATCVYEYKPRVAIGITAPPPQVGSAYTVRDVLNHITSSVQSPWFRTGVGMGARYVRSVMYGSNNRARLTMGEL